ncbi:zinc-binding dehydrogenase [Alloacidobacterium dinghuense]|uniref:Zinc-binding dehydrogenase n=1 Tax=Alloacidobacterium dinghuense TaxID=2763107 RepID=A0A7G8BKC1_9BACT|nr:zinc-binding dehydrogenase [Alloacidobacterium dinghuense]QNI32991.1 zinc-binding dehydrogenase [Alloacidobacterium dinghuense]
MANQMTAAVLYGKEDLRIEQVPVPSAGPGEIVVSVAAALTCGTDLKVYRRGYHAKMLKPPIAFGHELAGVVVEAGKGLTDFRVGDRVVALNSAPCDACYYCKHHQQNLCDDLLFNNGAYAEYIRIPARIVEKNTLHVPDGVPFEHAALTEPLACVVRGLEETNAQPGDTVVVIGAGPIGLMFINTAQLAGMHVIAVVKRDEQIEAAKVFGAEQVVQTTAVKDVVAAVRSLTPNNRGVDVAIEAVATPATWQQAVEMVRKGGVVNFFGGCAAGTKVELDTNRLHYNDITLKASFHHTPATARRAFELITSGQFNCREYITGRAPLSRLDEVFRKLMDRSSDIKTAIIP